MSHLQKGICRVCGVLVLFWCLVFVIFWFVCLGFFGVVCGFVSCFPLLLARLIALSLTGAQRTDSSFREQKKRVIWFDFVADGQFVWCGAA